MWFKFNLNLVRREVTKPRLIELVDQGEGVKYQLDINHPVFSRVSQEGKFEPDPTILKQAMNFFSNHCHRLRTLEIVFPRPVVKESAKDPDAPVSDVAR